MPNQFRIEVYVKNTEQDDWYGPLEPLVVETPNLKAALQQAMDRPFVEWWPYEEKED